MQAFKDDDEGEEVRIIDRIEAAKQPICIKKPIMDSNCAGTNTKWRLVKALNLVLIG